MIYRCAAEVDAWREVKDGWRPLYGDVDQFGVAVEWHDFRTERSFDWGRSFHPRSLEFCLNLQGHGAVGAVGRKQSDYVPGDSGYYAVGTNNCRHRAARTTIINSSPWNFHENICKSSSCKTNPISSRRSGV